MITKTSFNNPKFAKRIKREFWLLKMQAIKTKQRAVGYVKNRKGNNVLRIDVYSSGEVVCYAANDGMKNYASLILPIVSDV